MFEKRILSAIKEDTDHCHHYFVWLSILASCSTTSKHGGCFCGLTDIVKIHICYIISPAIKIENNRNCAWLNKRWTNAKIKLLQRPCPTSRMNGFMLTFSVNITQIILLLAIFILLSINLCFTAMFRHLIWFSFSLEFLLYHLISEIIYRVRRWCKIWRKPEKKRKK